MLDVKPWDDETDMAEMEKNVRTVVMDGLVWGACEYFLSSTQFNSIYIYKKRQVYMVFIKCNFSVLSNIAYNNCK